MAGITGGIYVTRGGLISPFSVAIEPTSENAVKMNFGRALVRWAAISRVVVLLRVATP